MARGDDYLRRGDIGQAIKEFQSAQIAARECGLDLNIQQQAGPTDRLQNTFDRLRRELAAAEAAREAAIKSKEDAERALQRLQAAQNLNDRILKKVEADLQQNKQLMQTFAAYDNKFILAVSDGKFGFTDRQGNTRIPYRYDSAGSFDDRGLARVGIRRVPKRIHPSVKRKQSGETRYLIDTLGATFLLATSMVGLNETDAQAVDLGGHGLGVFPDFSTLSSSPIAEKLYQQLEVLLLDHNRIERLPENIGNYTTLKWLDIADNFVRELPATLSQLQKLTFLRLDYNAFTAIPTVVYGLPNISRLEIAGNFITTLPPEIRQLEQLLHLGLSNNELTELPSHIGALTNLQVLDVSENYLSELPEAIGELAGLKTLYLNNNALTEIPEAIKSLQQLQTLTLTGNQLSEAEMGKIRKWLPNCTIQF